MQSSVTLSVTRCRRLFTKGFLSWQAQTPTTPIWTLRPRRLDALDDKAKMYGSVNTVAFKDGKATGYTTDPDGFIKALEAAGIDLDGRIMILGCGGVARTMAYEIALRGKPFEFAVRRESVGRAGLLCLDVTRKVPDAQVSFGLIDQIIGTVDVLINATPVGMYPHIDEQPIHNCAIGRCGAVYDAIYNRQGKRQQGGRRHVHAGVAGGRRAPNLGRLAVRPQGYRAARAGRCGRNEQTIL